MLLHRIGYGVSMAAGGFVWTVVGVVRFKPQTREESRTLPTPFDPPIEQALRAYTRTAPRRLQQDRTVAPAMARIGLVMLWLAVPIVLYFAYEHYVAPGGRLMQILRWWILIPASIPLLGVLLIIIGKKLAR